MVQFFRIILNQNYHPQYNPQEYTVQTLTGNSVDYEPMDTAWKTALAIMNSRICQRAFRSLTKEFQPERDPITSVGAFIADLNNDQIVSKYRIVADYRLSRYVLGDHKRPLFAIHLNQQYVRSVSTSLGDEEARLRCLLATTLVHELAHTFVTFLGYSGRDVTPEAINHPACRADDPGFGESGRYLEWKLWGGLLEWQTPDAGHLIGDLFLVDENNDARLISRNQVRQIGFYQDFGTPLAIGPFQVEPPPNDITYANCEGFRGLRSFANAPNPLVPELLDNRYMASRRMGSRFYSN
ncbi:hypothetical protein TWF694_005241 [Orbilia ellipsospora]|uniref:SprT-like domain-containing protein n=1 Tax=Orbilia ellipsospora TaxID=2528407 RepID=A0AAV9WSV3_9PEZI